MGNAYVAVDFGSLLACLQQLVMTSLPPSGTPSGVQEAPGTPLSADDAEMLSSDVFLKKLLSGEQGVLRFSFRAVEMANPPCRGAGINVDIARRLLAHVSWNNEPLAARIGEVIRAGVVAADGEAVVPWFKALAELLSIADDLQACARSIYEFNDHSPSCPTYLYAQARRFEQLVTSITTAMQSQAIYYKATEASIIQVPPGVLLPIQSCFMSFFFLGFSSSTSQSTAKCCVSTSTQTSRSCDGCTTGCGPTHARRHTMLYVNSTAVHLRLVYFSLLLFSAGWPCEAEQAARALCVCYRQRRV